MKKYFGMIAALVFLSLLGGCATVSKEDCLLTDWFEIGRMDGLQGKPRTGFLNRAKACLEHGVNADRQAYYRGHDDGLKYFCTEQKGFEPDFRTGYLRGKELYQYETKIASLKTRLDKIERKIIKKEKQLYSDELSDDQRNDIRSELKLLDQEYRELSRELNYMEKSRPIAKIY